MKRRTKLALGFTVAAISFASLMAFTERGRHFRHYGNHHCEYDRNNDWRGGEDANNYNPVSKPENKTAGADSAKSDR